MPGGLRISRPAWSGFESLVVTDLASQATEHGISFCSRNGGQIVRASWLLEAVSWA